MIPRLSGLGLGLGGLRVQALSFTILGLRFGKGSWLGFVSISMSEYLLFLGMTQLQVQRSRKGWWVTALGLGLRV